MTDTGFGLATTEREVERPTPEPGGRGARRPPRRNLFAAIALFYRQVVSELRKVIWPTRQELITYTIVVLVFVSVLVSIVAALDIGFARAVLAVFG